MFPWNITKMTQKVIWNNTNNNFMLSQEQTPICPNISFAYCESWSWNPST
jgi:hypothetical protein